MLPGTYLFEATTPLHDLIEATPDRIPLTVRAGELMEARVPLKPLARAAAEVCKVRELDRDGAVLAGQVVHDGIPAEQVRITVEWPGGEGSAVSRADGYYRICNVPTRKLALVRASRDDLMVTRTVTLKAGELVRRLDLELQR
jgi:hypothetical protein